MIFNADITERLAGPGKAPNTTISSSGLLPRILAYFGVAEKGSSLQTEVLAGVSTFLALSYIFVVNPAILAQAGMDKSVVLFATIVTSGLATLAMGLWARLPFVLAPGMEMNAYVAFFVVGALGFNWQQALGAVFWSGILFIVFTVTSVRTKIIDAIPERMKSGLSLSVGIFLGLVALKVAGILRYDGVKLVGVGSLTSPHALALYVSMSVALLLDRFRGRGAVMISILSATALCHAMGIGRDPEKAAQISGAMLGGLGRLDLAVLLQPKMLSVILILFLIDFYGSIAKLIGLTMSTNIALSGRVPGMRQALIIDSLATTGGSVLGTSSLTVYVESGVGIGIGGRTGLTAVVCGVLMLSCFALAPFLHYIPVVATTGALLLVAFKLCPSFETVRSSEKRDLIAMTLMQCAVVVTFAIDRALLIGLFIYWIADVTRLRVPSPYLTVSMLMLVFGAWLQSIT